MVYSGKGDKGETANFSAQLVSKNDPLLHFTGSLDELNSYLGLIRAMLSNEDSWQFAWKSSCNFIELIQRNLMKIMAGVNTPRASVPQGYAQSANAPNAGANAPDAQKILLAETDINVLENEINRLSKNLPKIRQFIIPGKNIIEAQIQVARTIARKAERYFFALDIRRLNKERFICSNAGAYLNRLSDYLFVLSQQESLINVNFINQISGL